MSDETFWVRTLTPKAFRSQDAIHASKGRTSAANNAAEVAAAFSSALYNRSVAYRIQRQMAQASLRTALAAARDKFPDGGLLLSLNYWTRPTQITSLYENIRLWAEKAAPDPDVAMAWFDQQVRTYGRLEAVPPKGFVRRREFLWAEFTIDTARPVQRGVSLSHCVIDERFYKAFVAQ